MLDLCHCTQSVSHAPGAIPGLGQPLLFRPRPLDPELVQTLTRRRPGLDIQEEYNIPSATLGPSDVVQTQLEHLSAPTSTEWLQELRWGQWLMGLQAAMNVLRQMITLPSDHQLTHWKDPQLQLEIVILAIHRLLKDYLSDANRYVQEKHGDL